MKIGEFFVSKGYIAQEQLDAALALQQDNPDTLIGAIMVTQGVLTTEELIKYVEHFIIETGLSGHQVNEWLTQTEIDEIINKHN